MPWKRCSHHHSFAYQRHPNPQILETQPELHCQDTNVVVACEECSTVAINSEVRSVTTLEQKNRTNTRSICNLLQAWCMFQFHVLPSSHLSVYEFFCSDQIAAPENCTERWQLFPLQQEIRSAEAHFCYGSMNTKLLPLLPVAVEANKEVILASC